METQLPQRSLPDTSQIGFGFWFQWVIANAAGFAIGTAIRRFLFGLGPWATNDIVEGVMIGAALGIVQVLNFKLFIEKSEWLWIATNIVGWTVAWAVITKSVGFSVLGLGITQVSIARALLAGLLVGLMQWLILRPRFQTASVWVAANAVGWTVGMAIGVAIGGAFGWPLVGAIGGAISGAVLMWLIRRPVLIHR